MVLKAFTEIIEPLEVTYDGSKVYRIPPVSIEAGGVLTDAHANPDEYKGRPHGWLAELVLGPLWGELKADRVGSAFANRVYLTALAEWQAGREYAEHIWAEGVDPKVVQAFLEAKAEEASTTSPSTAAATTTRSRARTSGTTSKTPPKK